MSSLFVFKLTTFVENCATFVALIGCIGLRYMPDHLSQHHYLTMHAIQSGIVVCIISAFFLGLISLLILNAMRGKSSQDVAYLAKWARWSILATMFVIVALVVLPVVHS
jgi:hypothetical protein